MLMPNYIFEDDFIEFEPLIKSQFPNSIHVKKGHMIIDPNDIRTKYYYVLKGQASFVIRHEDGGAKVSSIRGKGSIFPLFYNFKRTNMEKILEVKARTDMELIVIPRSEFLRMMLENSGIAMAMLDAYGRYTTLLLHDMSNILFDSVYIRICNFLALQTLVSGDVVNMTHDDIAEVAGTTRATVSRALNILKCRNVVSISRQKICILSREKLLSGCSYAVNLNEN